MTCLDVEFTPGELMAFGFAFGLLAMILIDLMCSIIQYGILLLKRGKNV